MFLLLEYAAFWARLTPRGLWNPAFFNLDGAFAQNCTVLIVYYLAFCFLLALLAQYVTRNGQKPAVRLRDRILTAFVVGIPLRLLLDAATFFGLSRAPALFGSIPCRYCEAFLFDFLILAAVFYLPLWIRTKIPVGAYIKLDKQKGIIFAASFAVAAAAVIAGSLIDRHLHGLYFPAKLNLEAMGYLYDTHPRIHFAFDSGYCFSLFSAIIGLCCTLMHAALYEKYMQTHLIEKTIMGKTVARGILFFIACSCLFSCFAFVKVYFPKVFPYDYSPTSLTEQDGDFFIDELYAEIKMPTDKGGSVVINNGIRVILQYRNQTLFSYRGTLSDLYGSGDYFPQLVHSARLRAYTFNASALIYKIKSSSYKAVPAGEIHNLQRDGTITQILDAMLKKQEYHRLDWVACSAEYLMKYQRSAILPIVKRCAAGHFTKKENEDSTKQVRQMVRGYFKELLRRYGETA